MLQNISTAQTVALQASAGWGPFAPSVTQPNTFTVANIPSGEVVQSASFVVYGSNGLVSPVAQVASQMGTSLSFTMNMGILPFHATLNVDVATKTASGSQQHYTLHNSIIVLVQTPTVTSATGMRGIVVGRAAQHRYLVSSLPPSTTRVALHLIRDNGTVIDSVIRTGTAIDTASIVYTTPSHKKKTTLSVSYTTTTSPVGGFRTTMVLADSVPLPLVRASLGWGPFDQGVGAVNQFVVKG